MHHKYKVGQIVRHSNATRLDLRRSISNIFEVVRIMPDDRLGEPLYRIKSSQGERAVREGDIALAYTGLDA